MNTTIDERGASRVIIATGEKAAIKTLNDGLDLIGLGFGIVSPVKLIVYKEIFADEYFDLSTRLLGDFLQKCVNYNTTLAIVGEFNGSDSLRDFIYESNNGSHVFFLPSLDDALNKLHGL